MIKPETTKKLTIQDCDDEFGRDAAYWKSQMEIYIAAGKPTEDVVKRMVEWAERHDN